MPKRFVVVAIERTGLSTTVEIDGIETESQAMDYAMSNSGELSWDEEALGISDVHIEGRELPELWKRMSERTVTRWRTLYAAALQGLANNDELPRGIATRAAELADHALYVEIQRFENMEPTH